MMEKKMLEELKGMSREERMDYFRAHKSELMENALDTVNGGAAGRNSRENPNSSCPYKNCYYTSFGWICDGVQSCG
ncbi:MAG: hypothetical protein IKE16_06760 [Solobacterium sp.]|nr:hypothetical protein [Solobacterium sp.]MBR2794333.1 hypothetical protein [Solobacterium sp.]